MRLLLFLFFFVLVSCDNSGTQKIESNIDREAALKSRVESRWADLKAGRLKKVYEFFSPEYRKFNSFKAFESSIGVSVEWVSVDVISVNIKENKGIVNTSIVYRLKLPGSIGEQFGAEMGEIQRDGDENWVWRAGQWWFAGKVKKGL